MAGGSSLRSWQLTHELSSLRSGVINIDDDLTYLYGQLPERIRAAAVAVMVKKMRAGMRVVTSRCAVHLTSSFCDHFIHGIILMNWN